MLGVRARGKAPTPFPSTHTARYTRTSLGFGVSTGVGFGIRRRRQGWRTRSCPPAAIPAASCAVRSARAGTPFAARPPSPLPCPPCPAPCPPPPPALPRFPARAHHAALLSRGHPCYSCAGARSRDPGHAPASSFPELTEHTLYHRRARARAPHLLGAAAPIPTSVLLPRIDVQNL